jgi:hypothetical protein
MRAHLYASAGSAARYILAPGHDPEDEGGKPVRLDRPQAAREDLPYKVELRRPDGALARALSTQLARAIFNAAKGEYPERRITLCKGSRIIADTSEPKT